MDAANPLFGRFDRATKQNRRPLEFINKNKKKKIAVRVNISKRVKMNVGAPGRCLFGRAIVMLKENVRILSFFFSFRSCSATNGPRLHVYLVRPNPRCFPLLSNQYEPRYSKCSDGSETERHADTEDEQPVRDLCSK